MHSHDLPRQTDDGLPIAEVGSWSEEKYRLVELYSSLFVRAMRGKWDSLVYLDLFAGSGYAKFKGTNRIVAASPLTVLALPEQFDCYIFCEADAENARALEVRCNKYYPRAEVIVLARDANASVDEIIDVMPQFKKGYRVLGFCFLDPFKLGNLYFSTIEQLSKRYMDFLVLIPSGMDANRNPKIYTGKANNTVDRFLGNESWRQRWQSAEKSGASFETFIVDEFGRSMSELKYIYPGLAKTAIVRSVEKNLLLYRLALFSTNALGEKFWSEAMRYANPQTQFNFGGE